MSDPVYIGYYTLDDATSMPDDARFLMYDPAGPGSYNITGALLKSQILASPNITGNLNFTGTGNRITGDFSNATLANRVMFQTSVSNSNTFLGAMPNVANGTSHFRFYNNNDPANAAYTQLSCSITGVYIGSNITGTGTLLPIAFNMAGTNQALLSTNGNFLIKTAAVQADDDNSAKLQVSGGILERGGAGIGYGAGSGGQVVQATSKSTAVTLNKPTGRIITAADALAAGQIITFPVNNSLVTGIDVIIAHNRGGGTGYAYLVYVDSCYAGGFTLSIKNLSAGSLSESIVINFAVIKGATA